MRSLTFDSDGYTRVPLTVDDAELIGDALAHLWHNGDGARRDAIVSLTVRTGLLVTAFDEEPS